MISLPTSSNRSGAKQNDQPIMPLSNEKLNALLAISLGIAAVRNKKDLFAATLDQLRALLPFNDIKITCISHRQGHHRCFLHQYEDRRRNHPSFDRLIRSYYPVNDGVLDVVMNGDEPVIFVVDELIRREKTEEYFHFYKATGVKELISIAIRNGDEEVGALFMTSETRGCFTPQHLSIVKSIAGLLSVAVENILANEEILRHEREKSILLDLAGSIATIREQRQLLKIVHEKIKKLIPFDDIVITLHDQERAGNKDQQRQCSQVFLSSANRAFNPELLLNETSCPFGAEVVQRTIMSIEPVIFTADEAMRTRTGTTEFVGVGMFKGDEVLGCIFICSEQKGSWSAKDFSLIKGITNQLTAAVINILANEEILEREKEKDILMAVSEDMSAIRNKSDLLRILHERLRKIFYFSHTVTILADTVQRTYTGFIFDPKSISRVYNDYGRVSTAHYCLDDCVMKPVFSSKDPVVLDMDYLMQRPDVPEWIKVNYAYGIREMILTQLNAGSKQIGAFVILSDKKDQFGFKQLKLVQGISCQLANTVANILANEELQARENETGILLELSKDIVSVRNKAGLLRIINEKLKKVLPISHTLTGILSEDRQWYSAFLLDPESASRNHADYNAIIKEKIPVADGVMDYVLSAELPVVFDLTELMKRPSLPDYLRMNAECGMKEVVFSPLGDGNRKTGVFVIFSTTRNRIGAHHLRLIQGISSQLSTAIANILANERIEKQMDEITRYKQQLEVENMYLQEEIQTTHNYGEIVGTSPAMRKVFQLVSQVAESQTSVLIMGETGTGKELIARALHNTSLRKDKLMVKVNCATLPANLIESELFGHERGSFTGATDRRIGKFELANHSTLFLDEVGELPLELQAKLLRALQEKEIERVGGRSVIRTDVRIIAATNRNLQKEVQLGNFRSDLYYRLNVFPIVIPPLRERKEDIPSLTAHFLLKHAKKGVKGGIHFASRVMKELMAYSWPGNIRELEHLIERSILLTAGTTISQVHLPITDRDELKTLLPESHIRTIDEVEREHIISILKLCNGKVAGIGGAAEKLQIPSTTLTSKIRRLNIKKGYGNE